MMNATLPNSDVMALDAATTDEPLPSIARPPARLISLDAFRGLAMVLMVSAGLGIPAVAKAYPDHPVWQRLAFHTDHVAWTGCGLWDLIQPCFMFMVGAAIPFSIASRLAKGQSFTRMFFHAAWRALALTALGVFLASTGSKVMQTNWTFTNVLAQIGLGYLFLFLLAWIKPRWQLVAALSILAAYWLAFALYPAPAADFDFASVNAAGWPYHLQGFSAHWEKNTNLGAAFDHWFLNLFPREKTFTGNEGGYLTLNFIPSLVTMTFGLLAGGLLRSPLSAGRKILVLLGASAVGLGVGFLLDYAGICPIVKRIWTPSWTLFSAGWAFLGLAFFYLTLDVVRVRFWALPLVVVGMNSIAVYCMSQLMKPFIRESIRKHLGQDIFAKPGGATYVPMVETATVLVVIWLVAIWMYRRRVFLKI